MSEQLWYYVDDAQVQHGPITIPELQALVENQLINQQTIVWTEALGEQWIPAANVEGLFPEQVEVEQNPSIVATEAVAPSLQADTAVVDQDVAEVAAASESVPVPAPTLASPNVQAPAPSPMEPLAAPEPAVVKAPESSSGTVDFSAMTNVAPIAVGAAIATEKVNPLLAPDAEIAKPKSLLGVQASSKPNPLLADAAAVKPQNKLNTSLPATLPAETSDEEDN